MATSVSYQATSTMCSPHHLTRPQNIPQTWFEKWQIKLNGRNPTSNAFTVWKTQTLAAHIKISKDVFQYDMDPSQERENK